MFGIFLVVPAILLAVFQPQPRKDSVILDSDICPKGTALSQDGRKLFVGGGTQKGGDWKLFELSNGKVAVNGMDGQLRCWSGGAVAISPDNSLMARGGSRNLLYLIDTTTGKLYWNLTEDGHVGSIASAAFTHDGKYLITTSGGDMMMRVWDIKNKKPHSVFRFTSPNPNLNQWKFPGYVETATKLYEIEGKFQGLYHCSISPSSGLLAIAGNIGGKVPLIDMSTGKAAKWISIKQNYVMSIQFTSDGKWLVEGGPYQTGMVEIWDVDEEKLVTSFGKHEWSVSHVAISPDKKTLVSGGVKDGFRVWDVASGKQKYSYFTKEDPRMPRILVDIDGKKYIDDETRAAGVAFLPDGKTFMIAPHWPSQKTEIYFHDTATGEPVDFRKRVAELPKVVDKKK